MITIEKWSGLITNASPYALPGGAHTVQTNIQCLRPGQLQVRNGMTQAANAGSGTVVSAIAWPTGSTSEILCQSGTQLVIVGL